MMLFVRYFGFWTNDAEAEPPGPTSITLIHTFDLRRGYGMRRFR